MEKDWKKIKVFTSAISAELAKQMLEEQGIVAVVMNKQDSSYLFGKIELYVNAKDEEQALLLIKDTEDAE